MKMTTRLAESLLDNLMCLAISANGGLPKEELTNEQFDLITKYAQHKFMEILKEWEGLFKEEWEFIE